VALGARRSNPSASPEVPAWPTSEEASVTHSPGGVRTAHTRSPSSNSQPRRSVALMSASPFVTSSSLSRSRSRKWMTRFRLDLTGDTHVFAAEGVAHVVAVARGMRGHRDGVESVELSQEREDEAPAHERAKPERSLAWDAGPQLTTWELY
jgi:hypothetical protein